MNFLHSKHLSLLNNTPYPEVILNFLNVSVSKAKMDFLTSFMMIVSALKSLNRSNSTPLRSEYFISFLLAAYCSMKFLKGMWFTNSTVNKLMRFSKKMRQKRFEYITVAFFRLNNASNTSYQISSSLPWSTSLAFFLQILMTYWRTESIRLHWGISFSFTTGNTVLQFFYLAS